MKSTRTTQVHQLMEKHNLGVLIFWRPEELVMLLGYYPLWGLSFLVYTPHQIILLVPEGEPDDLLPKGIVIQKFPWGRLSEHDPWECLYAQVNEIAKAQQDQPLRFSFIAQLSGSSPCRMSAEAPHLPSFLVARLLQTDAVYTPLDSELLLLFTCKNHVDIEGIQQAHRVISTAVQLFYQHAIPGMTEAKLASMIEYEVAIQMEQPHISHAKAWPLIQSGINSMDSGRFNRTTHRTIEEGDFVLLEMAACVNGYWLDITRTVVAGKSRPEQEGWIQIVRSAQCAAIAAIQPGVALSAIDAIARQYIEASGFGSLFNHALGHHVGFRYHDPGEGLHPLSKGVVTEGMVLTVEPGIYGAELKGGIRIEDNVLVTASGTRLLSDY